MKPINILYLYYDYSIYGEEYNIKMLKKYIDLTGAKCKIDYLTINDNIIFNKYDLVYIGSTRKHSQIKVLNDLKKYTKDIKHAIEKGIFFIILGNSMELFGRKIRTKKGLSINTLDIFSYQTREENFLISQDAFYEYDILNDNKRFIASKIKTRNIVRNDENRMFFLSDSFNYLNFYAMHLIGPILVRNPYFTLFILKRLYEYIGLDFSFFHNTIEIDAYKKFIDKYVIDVLEERK